ncbi:MAG: FAD-binding oxidoreductase [Thermaceae bacterium]|nr:FAD-binding oxidoreductase [Thermaceae bacterium]
MPNPDVVVIGAGIMGASTAYHLAKAGLKVVVLERRSRAGEGSTLRATGGYRAQFGTGINVKLSLLSRQRLLEFEQETGVNPGYQPCGYLFLASSPEQMQELRRGLAIQHQAGLSEAREVSSSEIAQITPFIALDGIVGGTFCPTDGFIRPANLLRGYVEAAQRLGAEFVYNVEHWQPVLENASTMGINTPLETYSSAYVINAGGAWAAEVGQKFGLELPVHPEKRQVALVSGPSPLPDSMPMSIFCSDGFHLRVRDGRVLLLYPQTPPSDNPFDTAFDSSWLSEVLLRAKERVPALANATIDPGECWAGLYEMSPDKHVIFGEAKERPGLYLINGSSGHGNMHAPALGTLMVELISSGQTQLDLSPLRPQRFAEGEPNVGSVLL